MPKTDHRLQAMDAWLKQTLNHPYQLEVASEDASFRRYFRAILDHNTAFIVMDAPPDKENCKPFMHVNRLFSQTGIHLPAIHAYNLKEGFLLLDDLGNTPYLQRLSTDTADTLYNDAMHSLSMLQHYSLDHLSALPAYDNHALHQEMQLFEEWFVQRLLDLRVTDHAKGLLHSVYQRLLETACQQPRVWVHRDYHSRNLMVTERHNPGIIDFQDAVTGPITYDLVSLLRDSYIVWPAQQVEIWSLQYMEKARQAAILPPGTTKVQWLHWFDWMGMQRQLKILGIFSRLQLRDGKNSYLKNIPLTFNYLLQTAKKYPEFYEFSRWLADEIQPRLTALAAF